MAFVQSGDVNLYVEETGTGYPIVFVHEFGSDHREWEPQVRWFSRAYRCITYNARGYPPSDVPEDRDRVRLGVRRRRPARRARRAGHRPTPTSSA